MIPRRRTRPVDRYHRAVDDRRIGTTAVLALENFLLSFSAPFVVVNGLLLMALIGLLDAVTGAFAVAVFYLVPIGLVTYARGRWIGTVMAMTAAFAWSGVELAHHVTVWSEPLTYWNWLTRFYVYEVIVLLVAPLRDVALREREIALKEAEAADRLRALQQLRAEMEQEGSVHLERLEAIIELRRAETEAEITRVG